MAYGPNKCNRRPCAEWVAKVAPEEGRSYSGDLRQIFSRIFSWRGKCAAAVRGNDGIIWSARPRWQAGLLEEWECFVVVSQRKVWGSDKQNGRKNQLTLIGNDNFNMANIFFILLVNHSMSLLFKYSWFKLVCSPERIFYDLITSLILPFASRIFVRFYPLLMRVIILICCLNNRNILFLWQN